MRGEGRRETAGRGRVGEREREWGERGRGER